MKLDDVKWAVKEMVRVAVNGAHVDCECHPRLGYKGPRREAETAPSEPSERAQPPPAAD